VGDDTVAHANEQVIRTMYDAFAHGDMEGVLACCTDDVLFAIPGNNRVAGDYRGYDDFLTKFLPALAAVADMSTFSEAIDGLACNDEHGVILTTQRFTRNDGTPVEFRSAVKFRFRDGKMSEFREHPGNQAEYDKAWS
jgi:ketosteroid isomerase-like protein